MKFGPLLILVQLFLISRFESVYVCGLSGKYYQFLVNFCMPYWVIFDLPEMATNDVELVVIKLRYTVLRVHGLAVDGGKANFYLLFVMVDGFGDMRFNIGNVGDGYVIDMGDVSIFEFAPPTWYTDRRTSSVAVQELWQIAFRTVEKVHAKECILF